MKRSFVFVPAILLVLFLINSFVLKEKEAGKKTNIVFKSTDGGQIWQDNNAGNKVVIDSIWRTWNVRPHVKAFMPYIFQVGENFVCVDPEELFRSSDKGKTWKLLLPAVENKIFNLFMSGNVIYAIPSKGGC